MQKDNTRSESLPSIQQCHKLWDKYGMPENIRAHTRSVTRVADAVALAVARQGIEVDVDLVNRGALLHDIAKLRGIQGGEEVRHTEEGGAIVLQEGLPARLGQVVRHHGLEEFSFDLPIEDQIINYADRRVAHDKIVSLHERMADLKTRYPKASFAIERTTPLYEEFERKYNLGQLSFRNG